MYYFILGCICSAIYAYLCKTNKVGWRDSFDNPHYENKGFTVLSLLFCIFVLLLIVGAYGWVWNVIKLVNSDFIITSGMSIGRVLGVFVLPLGSIIGFM